MSLSISTDLARWKSRRIKSAPKLTPRAEEIENVKQLKLRLQMTDPYTEPRENEDEKFLWSGGVHLINWESYLEGSRAIKSFIPIITQYQQSTKSLSCSWHFVKCVTESNGEDALEKVDEVEPITEPT